MTIYTGVTADPGWVTGTSYGIIGAFSNGVTQCVLDAGFSAENWYRVYRKAQDFHVVFGSDSHPVTDEGR